MNIANLIVLARDNADSCDNIKTLNKERGFTIEKLIKDMSHNIHIYNGYTNNISSTTVRELINLINLSINILILKILN